MLCTKSTINKLLFLLQADTDPMYVKCWASVGSAGHYPFSPNQYFMVQVPACWQFGHDALSQSWVNVGPPALTQLWLYRGETERRHNNGRSTLYPSLYIVSEARSVSSLMSIHCFQP